MKFQLRDNMPQSYRKFTNKFRFLSCSGPVSNIKQLTVSTPDSAHMINLFVYLVSTVFVINVLPHATFFLRDTNAIYYTTKTKVVDT